jgi:GT2 family glycosyltransferase
MPPAPTTTVVICSRGRPDLLADAVRSVLAMEVLPDELVVVDQSDQPQPDLAAGTIGVGSPVALRYLWAPDRGLSRARNVGVAAAKGDIVAFLDDDILVDPRWLDSVVRALTEGPDAGERLVISGQVRSGEPEVPGGWAPSTIDSPEPVTYRGRLRRDVLAAGNLALYRSAFDVVGTFDERLGAGTSLPSAEDNDFGYRLLRAGFTLAYRPEVVVVHRAWRREDALVRLRYDYGRGQGGYYAKYVARGDWFMLRRAAGDLAGHVLRAARRLVAGRVREAWGDVAYDYGILVGAVRRLSSR